jgi:Zn-dependent peptidase ImmA (M78 family)
MKTYENPAKLFLESHSVEGIDDVLAYADFLRNSSGISANPPVLLEQIFNQFGMQIPKFVSLPQQQGMIIPLESPQIIIHSGDSASRQRYSIAHELIELLFMELSGRKRFDSKKENIFGDAEKERVCQTAAAHLLMPSESFRHRSTELGLIFNSATILAEEYQVSLMAALCRLADMYSRQAVVVLWQMMNKPADIKKQVSKEQITLPGFDPALCLPKKLRVAWQYGKFKGVFIPRYKSIPEDSSVYKAWDTNLFTFGEENIPFGRYNRKAIIENKSFHIQSEKYVLSLIR